MKSDERIEISDEQMHIIEHLLRLIDQLMFIQVQSLVILQAIRGPTMLPSDLDGEQQLRFLLEVATGWKFCGLCGPRMKIRGFPDTVVRTGMGFLFLSLSLSDSFNMMVLYYP